jgi:hypothetical protein
MEPKEPGKTISLLGRAALRANRDGQRARKVFDLGYVRGHAVSLPIIAECRAPDRRCARRWRARLGVTQTYRLAQKTIRDDMEDNKAKTCANWISILRHVGTIS